MAEPDLDAATTAALEQLQPAMNDARTVAIYYATLRSADVPKALAAHLTLAYAAAMEPAEDDG